MKNIKRFSEITPKSIDKFNAFIANSPMVSYKDLVDKAIEMGHNPQDLIDAALGSVKYEKSRANLEDPIEDILNSVYENDPTPGNRYVLNPSDVVTKKGKQVAKTLKNNLGIASGLNYGKSRTIPNYVVIKKPTDDIIEKLQSIAHGGHELRHNEDFLIRPNIDTKVNDPYKKGHHHKGIYEPDELIREVKNLPKDEKAAQEILKQSKKMGLSSSIFTRLRSLLGPVSAGIGAYSALKSGDALAAGLEAASLVDPTGISDAAAEVNRRLKMSPEERKETSKEDFYSAMPLDIQNEQRLLDSLQDQNSTKFKKIKNKIKDN